MHLKKWRQCYESRKSINRYYLGQLFLKKQLWLQQAISMFLRSELTANKREIRAAVESMFGVKVEAVTTSNVKGKKKVFKGKVGQRINWKKAIVVKVSEGSDD